MAMVVTRVGDKWEWITCVLIFAFNYLAPTALRFNILSVVVYSGTPL